MPLGKLSKRQMEQAYSILTELQEVLSQQATSHTITIGTGEPLWSSGIQVNLDMTDPMGPGELVRHMQNPSYTYDKYLICIGLGPSISSVICKNPSYSGPSYP